MSEQERAWQWRYRFTCPMKNCYQNEETHFPSPDEAMRAFRVHMTSHASDRFVSVVQLFLPTTAQLQEGK